MLPRIVALAGTSIQHPESQMTEGHERAHLELVGDGDRLPVMRTGRLDIGRFSGRRDLSQDRERRGFTATLTAFAAGGGIAVSTTDRTFIRLDATDRIVRYPGPTFSPDGTSRDAGFFSHDFRFAAGAGIPF